MKRQRGTIELLALVLIISIVANFLLYRGLQDQKARTVKAETNLTAANGQTKTCNDSIAGLKDAAEKRGIQAGIARERARTRATGLEKQADIELSTPPTVPGDACKSAQDRVSRILRQRHQP